MISQNSIESVRDAASLVEIIGESTALQIRGTSVKACCPFHAEKTPSFHIHEEEGYYYCFGCGASGNVITFLMKARGMRFPEAVEYLAERYGVELERKRDSPGQKDQFQKKKALLRLNVGALNFFRHKLGEHSESLRDYLKLRGISHEIQQRFGVGFAPNSWRELSSFFKSRNVSEELLLETGLLRRNSKGELYDLFRGRLIFPIVTEARRVVAFGGRILPAFEEPDKPSPKYINTPETMLYKKSETLFGLPQALAAIREQQSIYVVEGYMDVLGLHRVGICNVVATCGTALTAGHLKKLGRLSRKIILFFDGDLAGKKAAARVFKDAIGLSMHISCLFLPKGEDPDSFAAKQGAEAIAQLKGESLLRAFVAWKFSEEGEDFSTDNPDAISAAAKGKIASEAASALRAVSNPIERAEYFKELAFALRVDEKSIVALAESSDKATAGKGAEGPAGSVETSSSAADEPVFSQGDTAFTSLPVHERSILQAAMLRKETLPSEILSNAELCMALSNSSRQFLEGLCRILESEGGSEEQQKRDVLSLLGEFGSGWKSAWAQAYELAKEPEFSFEQTYQDAAQNLRLSQLNDIIGELEERLRFSEEGPEKEELTQQKLLLLREREAMRARS